MTRSAPVAAALLLIAGTAAIAPARAEAHRSAVHAAAAGIGARLVLPPRQQDAVAIARAAPRHPHVYRTRAETHPQHDDHTVRIPAVPRQNAVGLASPP